MNPSDDDEIELFLKEYLTRSIADKSIILKHPSTDLPYQPENFTIRDRTYIGKKYLVFNPREAEKRIAELNQGLKNFQRFLKANRNRIHLLNPGIVYKVPDSIEEVEESLERDQSKSHRVVVNVLENMGYSVFLTIECDYLGDKIVHQNTTLVPFLLKPKRKYSLKSGTNRQVQLTVQALPIIIPLATNAAVPILKGSNLSYYVLREQIQPITSRNLERDLSSNQIDDTNHPDFATFKDHHEACEDVIATALINAWIMDIESKTESAIPRFPRGVFFDLPQGYNADDLEQLKDINPKKLFEFYRSRNFTLERLLKGEF